jgi:hypothetical protein
MFNTHYFLRYLKKTKHGMSDFWRPAGYAIRKCTNFAYLAAAFLHNTATQPSPTKDFAYLAAAFLHNTTTQPSPTKAALPNAQICFRTVFSQYRVPKKNRHFSLESGFFLDYPVKYIYGSKGNLLS